MPFWQDVRIGTGSGAAGRPGQAGSSTLAPDEMRDNVAGLTVELTHSYRDAAGTCGVQLRRHAVPL